MIYTWKHRPTGIKIEIERKMSDSDLPPTFKELLDQGLIEPDFLLTKNWEKVVIGGSFTKTWKEKGKW